MIPVGLQGRHNFRAAPAIPASHPPFAHGFMPGDRSGCTFLCSGGLRPPSGVSTFCRALTRAPETTPGASAPPLLIQGGVPNGSPPQMRRGGAPGDGVVLSRKCRNWRRRFPAADADQRSTLQFMARCIDRCVDISRVCAKHDAEQKILELRQPPNRVW